MPPGINNHVHRSNPEAGDDGAHIDDGGQSMMRDGEEVTETTSQSFLAGLKLCSSGEYLRVLHLTGQHI